MTSRIEDTLAQARTDGRCALVAFLTVGYPDVESTLRLVPALVEGGADIIELGVPFSDPIGDGPTVQAAGFHALQQGVTMGTCLEVVRELRSRGVTAPLILMGYYNPVIAHGVERFASDAAEAGADGAIVVDLPPEESGPLRDAFVKHDLRLIYLLSPTSTEERIRQVAEMASGFVYCVSVAGVTGARSELPADLEAFVGRVRAATNLPLAVGFGISQPEHFRAVARLADAAVIGSAIIDEITNSDPSEREARLKNYAEVVTGRRGAAA
jgi:tryptophan synthase alpha chain